MGERVKDKVVIVTGAGSIGPGWGNGKAAAVLYAREGAQVLAVDLQRDGGRGDASDHRRRGRRPASPLPATWRRPAMWRPWLRPASPPSAGVDILHNNVGIVEAGRAGRSERGELGSRDAGQRHEHVPHLQARAAAHGGPVRTRGRGGAIVNIGSLAGIRWTGVPYISYAASKAAVSQFSQERRDAVRGPGHPLQHHPAGADEHAVDRRAADGRLRSGWRADDDRAAQRAVPDRRAWATPGTSPTRRCSSPPTKPSTSPASTYRWTAASR